MGDRERPGSQGTDSKIGKAGTHKGGCSVLDASLGTAQGWRDCREKASPCFSAVRFLRLPTMLHSQPRCCREKLWCPPLPPGPKTLGTCIPRYRLSTDAQLSQSVQTALRTGLCPLPGRLSSATLKQHFKDGENKTRFVFCPGGFPRTLEPSAAVPEGSRSV